MRLLPFVFFVALVAPFAPAQGPAVAAPRKPNVLLILIDDLGWMDLHCQGNTRLDTPHVDRLARQGMRFTDAYAASPVCSPVRAAIMTGLAPARLRITNHLPDQERFTPKDAALASAPMGDHLPPSHVTMAEHLAAAGYATAFMGKWHLAKRAGKEGAGRPEHYPENQGFDVNIGGCAYGGPPTYWDPYRIHNLPPRKPGEYLPDRLADEAVRYIRKQKDTPWLLCLWNYAVHWPMEAPADLVAKYQARKGPGIKDARYAGMIEAMDRSIGRVLWALDDAGVADETLVIFTSDNGAYGGVSDIRPLRLDKGHLYEGGIRVPLIVRWPGHVAANTLSAAPVISTDLFPTVLAAAGVPVPEDLPKDGVDLGPILGGAAPASRGALFWHYPNHAFHGRNRLGSAMRDGPWKLLHFYDEDEVELYDLSNDIGETENLARAHPERAAAMKARLLAWREETNAAAPTRR